MADEGEEPSEARYWAPDDGVGIPCGKYVKDKQEEKDKHQKQERKDRTTENELKTLPSMCVSIASRAALASLARARSAGLRKMRERCKI